ncbi:hypothetical protein C8R46DRAFT_1105408 [Mycena filopes]|nr:hypothetical protein C8R46DRAFT_1105408 [Mycena filopes]
MQISGPHTETTEPQTRASSDKFSRAHQPSAKASSPKDAKASTSTGGRNPIFKTEQFGQHILNP